MLKAVDWKIIMKYVLSVFLVAPWTIVSAAPVSSPSDKSKTVAMRLIGHKLLSCIGDDSSRVSSVSQNHQSYTISFGQSLSINPTDLELIVSEVISAHHIANDYWVEVYSCPNREVQHSYQVGPLLGTILTCDGRMMPTSCYEIVVTLYTPEEDMMSITPMMTYIPLLLILVIGIISLYQWRQNRLYKSRTHIIDRELISIGASIFDKKNMRLSYKDETVDLSHKEAELLYLLYNSENAPIARAEILKAVWDDEGDYVGRTLDVFISRLRKKLKADQSIKILNIRGVGYKLVSD